MSALIKVLFIAALLALMTGPVWAAGFNSLQIDPSSCLSDSDTEAPKLDENGNPIIPPEYDEEEEEEEPDCE